MDFNLYTRGFQAFMANLVVSGTLMNRKAILELEFGDEKEPRVLLEAVNDGFVAPVSENSEDATLFCVKGVFKENDCYVVLFYENERICRVYEAARLKKGESPSIVTDMAIEDIYHCTCNEVDDVIEMIERFYDFGIEAAYMSAKQVDRRRSWVA